MISDADLRLRVALWQKELKDLGVSHYRVSSIEVVPSLLSPDAAAGVMIDNLYDTVSFEFRRDSLDEATIQEVDERIIHEWVHVAMRDLDRIIETTETWMPRATYEDFEDNLMAEREGLVEKVARALYAAHSRTC